jgi:glycosyltransferase involved in cell wall biosynthesis
VEYAVAGLGGPIYYAWPMLRTVMRTARLIAVHNPRVAADLRDQYPDARVETIRLGTPAPAPRADARVRVRAALGIDDDAVVFTAFGKITAEKRIAAIVRAFGALGAERSDVHLVLAGDASDYSALATDAAAAPARRLHVTGYLPQDAVDDHLAATDVCLCLRWPTALESSASWLQCLAAGRATVISDLAHLVDVPSLDPRTGRASHGGAAAVALRVDLLDEDATLLAAMRGLAGDGALRRALGDAGRAYWSAGHTLDAMADDYQRAIARAAGEPARRADDLPAHFTEDYSTPARAIARAFGIELDILA